MLGLHLCSTRLPRRSTVQSSVYRGPMVYLQPTCCSVNKRSQKLQLEFSIEQTFNKVLTVVVPTNVPKMTS